MCVLVKSPKSEAFPVEAIVIYSKAFVLVEIAKTALVLELQAPHLPFAV